MPEINIPVIICGRDMIASIEYTVTDPGRKGGRDFPTEPMEFEAEVLGLKDKEEEFEWWDAPSWLETAILNHYSAKIYMVVEENERD